MWNKLKLRKSLLGTLAMVLALSVCTFHLSAKTDIAYTANYEDSDVKISVAAKDGVLPVNAQLSVTPVKLQAVSNAMSEREKAHIQSVNEQYRLTSEKIKEQSGEVEGFVAYDISFLVNGEEIEPNGDVEVAMDFIHPTKPEGVSEDAVPSVQHLKEEGSAIIVETLSEQDRTISVDQEAAVKKVSYNANSFSIFTITWERQSNDNKNQGTNQLNIKVIDKDGNELAAGTKYQFNITADVLSAAALANQVVENANGALAEYSFVKAYVKMPQGDTEFKNIRRWGKRNDGKLTGGIQAKDPGLYDLVDWVPDTDGQKYVYLVFKEKEKFTKVDTIDSTSKGIHMRMIDFYPNKGATKPFTGADSQPNGEARQGVLQRVLDEDGYPLFTTSGYTLRDGLTDEIINGTSMKYLFTQDTNNVSTNIDYRGTLVDANYLFLKSVYDQPGHYFYYNSGENSATFDESTGDFTVYDQLTTPSNTNTFWAKRGNFLPYNTYHNMRLGIYKNLFQANGDPLPDTDIRKGENLYLPDQSTKFTFGMELNAKFLQDKDGYYDGNRMRYEFTGDDDLWVFIDGVLVLDIGGGHDAREGYIDFSTGEVWVQSKNRDLSTTIYEQFKAAGKEDAVEWKDVTYTDLNGNEKTGKIFKDYSPHDMRMWYMEHGGGASNLKIKFNLPVIPDNQIWIEKELGEETDDIKYGNTEYGFKLYADKTGTDGYSLVTNAEDFGAFIQTSDGVGTRELNIDENGVFYLKPNEIAKFNDVVKYYVEEIGISKEDYEKVIINDKKVVLPDGFDQIKSDEYIAMQTPSVVFQNIPTKENLQTLTIEKTMKENSYSIDTFNVLLSMEDENGSMSPYQGEYKLIHEDGIEVVRQTENGILPLKVNEQAKIDQILTGTQFEVTEQLDGDLYGTPIYTVNGQMMEGTSASGEINKGTSVNVTIENRYARVGELSLHKVDLSNQISIDGVIFGIYEGDREVLRAVTDAFGKLTFNLSYLRLDTDYTLKEIQPLEGYQPGMVANGKTDEYYKLNLKEAAKESDGTSIVVAELKHMDDTEIKPGNKDEYVIGNIPLMDLTIVKEWDDHNYVNRPDEIEVQLYQIINGEERKVPDQVLVLSKENEWKGLFENLPVWDAASDSKITYTVKELNEMEEYKATITDSKENGQNVITVTNSLQVGKLTINKQIIDSDVDPDDGDPIFTFEIRRTDDSMVFYRIMRLSDFKRNDSVTIENLPFGTYTVTELKTLRYECQSEITQTVTIDEEHLHVVANYDNKLIRDDSFSHTDVIENQFMIGEDGTVTIKPNKLTGVEDKNFPLIHNLMSEALNILKGAE